MKPAPERGIREPEKAGSWATFIAASVLAGVLLGIGITIGENVANILTRR